MNLIHTVKFYVVIGIIFVLGECFGQRDEFLDGITNSEGKLIFILEFNVFY